MPALRSRPLLAIAMPLAVAMPLALTGCSNAPIGQQLANSFGSPEQSPAKQTPAKPADVAVKPVPVAAKPAAKPVPVPVAVPATVPVTTAPLKSLPPAPYRVVLRLPAADPAAPAEALTRALRSANLPFEVETIERVVPGVAPAPLSPGAAASPSNGR
jgi:hypothetical protein